MYKYKILIIAVFISIGVLIGIHAFAEDAGQQAPVMANQADMSKELSIYGEVKSVNLAAGSLSVQYYDYDSDEEKTAEIAINKDTKIENVLAINDIKQGDWVDVTYNISDGKNAAKLVSVEKEEAELDMQADYESATLDEE